MSNLKRKFEGPSTSKTFQEGWLELPEFKDWLEPVKDQPSKSYCRVCNSTMKAGKSELVKHSNMAKHVSFLKQISTSKTLTQMLSKSGPSSHEKNVKSAEIALSAFFAEHNVALSIVDHLVPLLKNIFPDSKIASDMRLKRTKCTKIVENVIAKVEVNRLVKILQVTPFSILVDEGTDISNQKSLCCLARYVDPVTCKINTELLDLIKLNSTDCSAESLFNSFKNCLQKHEIPIVNVIALACDNAAVMVGKRNSFFSRLKALAPRASLLNCICHSSALVASYSCSEIPEQCENLMTMVSSYMSESAKSCAILEEFQEYFNVEKKKILSPSRTRWLVLHSCVVRLLDNWTALQHMFLLESIESKRVKAKNIYESLIDSKIKAYFLFLKFVLKFFNDFNKLFQGHQVLLHLLHSESVKILLKLSQNVVKEDVLEVIVSEEFVNFGSTYKGNLMEPKDIYLGLECEQYLQNMSQEEIIEIKERCKNFYIRSIDEILKRFPILDSEIKVMEFLSPEIALNASKRINCKNISLFSSKVSCDEEKLISEWRELPVSIAVYEKERLQLLPVEQFWQEVSAMKTFEGNLSFPYLSQVARYALTFPHSNADAERLFSIVTDVKIKKRNSLSSACLNAICFVRSGFKSRNIECYTFKPDDEHFSLLSSAIYKTET